MTAAELAAALAAWDAENDIVDIDPSDNEFYLDQAEWLIRWVHVNAVRAEP